MAEIEIRLPKMGDSVTEATITNWLKEVGDSVEMDEPLVEVATDKVDNELPSEAAGVLIKKLFEKDEVVQVGQVIAIISTGGAAAEIVNPVSTSQVSENKKAKESAPMSVIASSNDQDSHTAITKSGPSGRFAWRTFSRCVC